jgi:hypothetical protein
VDERLVEVEDEQFLEALLLEGEVDELVFLDVRFLLDLLYYVERVEYVEGHLLVDGYLHGALQFEEHFERDGALGGFPDVFARELHGRV